MRPSAAHHRIARVETTSLTGRRLARKRVCTPIRSTVTSDEKWNCGIEQEGSDTASTAPCGQINGFTNNSDSTSFSEYSSHVPRYFLTSFPILLSLPVSTLHLCYRSFLLVYEKGDGHRPGGLGYLIFCPGAARVSSSFPGCPLHSTSPSINPPVAVSRAVPDLPAHDGTVEDVHIAAVVIASLSVVQDARMLPVAL